MIWHTWMKKGLAGSVGRIRRRTVVWRREKKRIGKDKGALSIVGQAGFVRFLSVGGFRIPAAVGHHQATSDRERVYGFWNYGALSLCHNLSPESMSPGTSTWWLTPFSQLTTSRQLTTPAAPRAILGLRVSCVLPQGRHGFRGDRTRAEHAPRSNTGVRECQETPALPLPHSPAT